MEGLDKIRSIVLRATRAPKGQECWDLRREGGCLDCEGFGTVQVFACGDHCPRTDHRHCGQKSAPCPTCCGTGLGISSLFEMLKKIGKVVGVEVGLPTRTYSSR